METDRLLRDFVPGDIDELVRLHNDPAVMKHLTGGAPISRATIEAEYHERFVAYGYRAGVEKVSDRFIGWYGLHDARGGGDEDEPGDQWLGYRLHRDAWGHGYATEGVRALIDEGFRQRGVQRVRAATMAVNAPSRRVMERAGLTYVRTFHEEWDDPLPGTELGEVEYALTREAWERLGESGLLNRPPTQ